ncbi:hypothetical protein BMF94_6878 [Rhodotorula taiwanensis]|uniref:Amine oxidase domain-containing protein n=1 Tax=Rhodotorula taiwanensis TaxID=741276 RepID=A0A2S5AZZ9_9BASI|nr:hypothetical protein BMF94_6878 [Rhodotorula taiwanensis]
MTTDRSARKRPVRVAIVGTGLAGLSTAYFLSTLDAIRDQSEEEERLQFEVHLLDRSDSIGMDTASLSIKSEDGQAASYRVDVPMRSINGGESRASIESPWLGSSHGRVRRLYEHLGVPLVQSDFSYSFSRLARSAESQSRLSPAAAAGGEAGEISEDGLRPNNGEVGSAAEDDSLSDEATRTPPPSYTEAAEGTGLPLSTAPRAGPVDLDSKSPSSPLRLDRPESTASLLYQGASGLRWPPVSLPSHLGRASLRSRLVYATQTTLLAISYLYLLVLAFVYVSLGLARPRSAAHRQTCHSPLVRRTWELSGLAELLNVAATPLGEFCLRHRLPQRLVEGVLIPLMAAVATVGVDEAREMPTGEVLAYIVETFAHSHYVTCPSVGVRGIVRRLVAPIPPAQIHLGADIIRIERVSSSVVEASPYRIVYRSDSDGQQEEATLKVDHVVFATQADQAARLVSTLEGEDCKDSSVRETVEALEAFTYVRTLVVTHRDESVLPPALDDRRDLNLAVFEPPLANASLPGGTGAADSWDESLGHLPPSSVQTTHILSARSQNSSSPVLQTTNPVIPIDPDRILASTWFSRAFATAESQAVLGRFLLPADPAPSRESSPASLQGQALGQLKGTESSRAEPHAGGIWFVGSYVATGFPLLEGCVSSAEAVVRELVREQGGHVQRWAY